MDQRIAEAFREEIMVTGEAHGYIINFWNQIKNLTKRLGDMKEEVGKAS